MGFIMVAGRRPLKYQSAANCVTLAPEPGQKIPARPIGPSAGSARLQESIILIANCDHSTLGNGQIFLE
jgi:hypothetical protein